MGEELAFWRLIRANTATTDRPENTGELADAIGQYSDWLQDRGESRTDGLQRVAAASISRSAVPDRDVPQIILPALCRAGWRAPLAQGGTTRCVVRQDGPADVWRPGPLNVYCAVNTHASVPLTLAWPRIGWDIPSFTSYESLCTAVCQMAQAFGADEVVVVHHDHTDPGVVIRQLCQLDEVSGELRIRRLERR